MKKITIPIDLFDRYLAGEMNPGEEKNLEFRFQRDKELYYQFLTFKSSYEALRDYPAHLEAKALVEKAFLEMQKDQHVQYQRHLNEEIKGQEKLEFEKQLKESEWESFSFEKYKNSLPPSKDRVIFLDAKVKALRNLVRRVAVAAILLVGLGLCWWLFRPNAEDNISTLAARYDTERPKAAWGLALPFSTDTPLDTAAFRLKKEGLIAFDAYKTDLAIALLEQYMAQLKSKDDIAWVTHLFIGRCYAEKRDFAKAYSVLDEAESHLQTSEDLVFLYDEIRWQKALVLLRMRKIKEVKELLFSLSSHAKNDFIKEKSINLFNELP
ncbi:MAG: hypothetical protein HUU01_01755 [Saprospiraceae bacterium]|nr:hypothetical protein [Saprospiraceae bacterium]